MRARLAAALTVVAITATSAGAATALKPVRGEGFRMRVPATWRVLKNIGTVKLYAISPTMDGGFRVNANVVVTPSQSGPPTGLRGAMVKELAKAGIKVSWLSSRNMRLPAGEAVELRYRGTMLGRTLRWLAYVLQRSGQAYVVTFTDSDRSYSRHAALFRTMARSFRIG